MAGRLFNRGGNLPSRRTGYGFRARERRYQFSDDDEACEFRGQGCHFSDDEESFGWRRPSGGGQKPGHSGGFRRQTSPHEPVRRFHRRPAVPNRDCMPRMKHTQALSRKPGSCSPPCSCEEDFQHPFPQEVRSQIRPLKQRRLGWAPRRGRFVNDTLDRNAPCDLDGKMGGISDEDAMFCNKRHPRRPPWDYTDPGFAPQAKRQRSVSRNFRMSMREDTFFREDAKAKRNQTYQASRWMYANEHGQMSGPYSLKQLFEGLKNGFLPKNLPVHRLCHGDLEDPTPLKSLFQGQDCGYFPENEGDLNYEKALSSKQSYPLHQGWSERDPSSCDMEDHLSHDVAENCSLFYDSPGGFSSSPFGSAPQRGCPPKSFEMQGPFDSVSPTNRGKQMSFEQCFDEVNYPTSTCWDEARWPMQGDKSADLSDCDGSIPPGFEAVAAVRTSSETSLPGFSGVTTAEEIPRVSYWEVSDANEREYVGLSNGRPRVSDGHIPDEAAMHYDKSKPSWTSDVKCHAQRMYHVEDHNGMFVSMSSQQDSVAQPAWECEAQPNNMFAPPIQGLAAFPVSSVCVGIPIGIPGAPNWNLVNTLSDTVHNDSPTATSTSFNSLGPIKAHQVRSGHLGHGIDPSFLEERGLHCIEGEESENIIRAKALTLVRKELLAAVRKSYCRTILSALVSESLSCQVDKDCSASKYPALLHSNEHAAAQQGSTKSGGLNRKDSSSAEMGGFMCEGSNRKEHSIAGEGGAKCKGLDSECKDRDREELCDVGGGGNTENLSKTRAVETISKSICQFDSKGNTSLEACGMDVSIALCKMKGGDLLKPLDVDDSVEVSKAKTDATVTVNDVQFEGKEGCPQELLRSLNGIDKEWKSNYKLVLPYLLKAQKMLLELEKLDTSSAVASTNEAETVGQALDTTTIQSQTESNIDGSTEKMVLAALRSLCTRQ